MAPKKIYTPVSSPADIRTKAVDMLKEVVWNTDIARFLERATWNHAVTFCKRKYQPLNWDNFAFRNAYTQKVLGVRYVARERPDVLKKYMELDPTLKAFVNAQPWELWPEKWEKAFEDASRKALRFTDASTIDLKLMSDGILACRCGSKKTSYSEMQCRSADEPMTVLAKCHECGKRWKQ